MISVANAEVKVSWSDLIFCIAFLALIAFCVLNLISALLNEASSYKQKVEKSKKITNHSLQVKIRSDKTYRYE